MQYNDGDLVVRGEYLNGVTGYYDGVTMDTDGNLIEQTYQSNGYYAVAGYNFRFGKDNGQKLMPVLRYEQFTNNGAATNYYTVGINYWPVKSLNFKLDYSLIQPDGGNNSHRVVGILSYKF